MTLEEILQSQGLNDEQVQSVVGEMKQNKIYTASEENLDVRYKKLKGDHDAASGKLNEANTLIQELQANNSDNAALQAKVAEYEGRVQELEAQNQKIQAESALKVALLEAKAQDIDYLAFKIREKNPEGVKLDENGKVVGIEDTIDALKTQFPTQFATGGGEKKIDEHKLEQGDDDHKLTKEEFDKMGYQERVKLYKEDPETYNALKETKN